MIGLKILLQALLNCAKSKEWSLGYIMEQVEYQNQVMRRWGVGPSTFLACPEKGARLLNWHLNMGDGSVRDVVHWPEDNQEADLSKVHGGIPVLFPFAGKCYLEGEGRLLENQRG